MSSVAEYQLLDLIGRERLRRLQLHLGGTRLYIPTRLSPDDDLVQLLGWELAKVCSDQLGNSVVHIRKTEIIRERNLVAGLLRAAGLPTEMICAVTNLRPRTIRDIIRQ